MATATKPASKSTGGSNRRLFFLGGGALIAVVVLAIVFALAGGDDETTAVQVDEDGAVVNQTNDVVVDGTALPEFEGSETAQRMTAPQVTGVGFDGETLTLLEPGTPTVIGFFAHWCPHCQAEVDELSRHLVDTGLPADVSIMAVSTGVDSDQGNYPPSAWFESEGWPTPVLTDDPQNTAARSYGLSGFPFWAIVDADGNLISRTAGGIGADQLDEFIELARAGG